MMETPLERVENRLIELAGAFPYPPTPDIAGAVAGQLAGQERPRRRPVFRRRLAWAIAAILVVSAALLSVPTVRAQILEFIQVGLVRIFLAEPITAPNPTPRPGGATREPSLPTPGSGLSTGSPEGQATPISLATGLNLDGHTTLENALVNFNLPILLPYPKDEPDFPDEVFLQDLGAQVLVLVWLDPNQAGQVRYSLHILEPGNYSVDKVQPLIVDQSTVNGETAYWTTGPYLLRLKNKSLEILRLIEGHVLIWAEGEITYRLETDLPLEEAIRLADSLRPYPQER